MLPSLALPSPELQKKLAEIMEEHVMVVKIDAPGRAVVDGKPVKVTKVPGLHTCVFREDMQAGEQGPGEKMVNAST